MKIIGYLILVVGSLLAFYGLGKLAKASPAEVVISDPNAAVAVKPKASADLSQEESLGAIGVGAAVMVSGMGLVWAGGRRPTEKKKKRKD